MGRTRKMVRKEPKSEEDIKRLNMMKRRVDEVMNDPELQDRPDAALSEFQKRVLYDVIVDKIKGMTCSPILRHRRKVKEYIACAYRLSELYQIKKTIAFLKTRVVIKFFMQYPMELNMFRPLMKEATEVMIMADHDSPQRFILSLEFATHRIYLSNGKQIYPCENDIEE